MTSHANGPPPATGENAAPDSAGVSGMATPELHCTAAMITSPPCKLSAAAVTLLVPAAADCTTVCTFDTPVAVAPGVNRQPANPSRATMANSNSGVKIKNGSTM